MDEIYGYSDGHSANTKYFPYLVCKVHRIKNAIIRRMLIRFTFDKQSSVFLIYLGHLGYDEH